MALGPEAVLRGWINNFLKGPFFERDGRNTLFVLSDAGMLNAQFGRQSLPTRTNPYSQPTATAEIEWLKDPPEETRGKWVALIGSALVGMADSAEELRQSLKSKKFDQFPLVQYVAP